jgi:GPI-anchor transamidase subunit GAA1
MESTLRTANNLLEHLHASFFFYILTGPDTFMKIGSYLPSAILISVSLMVGGLADYVNAGWERTRQKSSQWIKHKRPVMAVMMLMASTHAAGAMLFFLFARTRHIVRR